MPVSNSTWKWLRLGLWAAVALATVLLLVLQLGRSGAPTNGATPLGGPFKLTAHTGEQVSDRDFRGKVMLIYFGFTYCPDVCPTGLQTIAAALDKLPEDIQAQIQPIFISVDPERDTPEVLEAYVTYFVPGMIGLTGSPSDIQTVANNYRVAYWKEDMPDSALDYTINHASLFFIMDRNGSFLRAMPTSAGTGIDPANVGTPDNLAAALSVAVKDN